VNLSDFWVIIFLSRQSPRAKEVVTPIYESSYRRGRKSRKRRGEELGKPAEQGGE
jgi:hypothetical protein